MDKAGLVKSVVLMVATAVALAIVWLALTWIADEISPIPPPTYYKWKNTWYECGMNGNEEYEKPIGKNLK